MAEITSENAKARCVHVGVCMRSEAYAEQVFGNLFGFERIKDFEAPATLMNNLFQADESARVLLFDAGPIMVEVFISASRAGGVPGYSHLCLAVADRDTLVKDAESMGFSVRRHERPDGSFIVFLQDEDSNLYEIKEL